jgi:MFS family permease
MLRAFDFLRVRDLPWMTRPNYASERSHMALWGVLAGVIEGNTSSIVVAKTFGASNLLITVVWATPMVANMLSLLWADLLRGRGRKRSFLLLNAAAVLSLMSVGLTPSSWTPWGGWLFALQICLARIFLAGMVTVRSGMWSLNYPNEFRARITGRLQSLRFLVGLFAAAAIASLFNHDPEAYRWIYPAVGVVGVLSLSPLRGFRVRAERNEIRAARRRHPGRRGTRNPFRALLQAFRDGREVLKRDRPFARYCTAQHFLGSANFVVDPVLTIVVTKQLGLDYFQSGALLDLIPNIVMLFALPFWSAMFDRVGVLRFRVTNSAVWLASSVLAGIALLCLSLPIADSGAWCIGILVLSRVVQGVGRGGGAIAWNLGHLQFAGRHQTDLYMSIHVALTGLRGTTMPFLALGAYHLVGWGAIVIAAVLGGIAQWLFVRLAAEEARQRDAAGAAPHS